VIANATTPIAVTAQNVERQPCAWPSHVPNGTPTIVATVRPVNMIAIADARLSGATSWVATTEPTPKNVPCASAVTRRASISVSYVGASAHAALPSVNTAISASSTVLRGQRAVSAVTTGAPIVTPSA